MIGKYGEFGILSLAKVGYLRASRFLVIEITLKSPSYFSYKGYSEEDGQKHFEYKLEYECEC